MTSSRRIHFGVCGIGYGHAARSAIIIRELERRGLAVTVSSYDDGLRYLRSVGVDALQAPPISYGVLPEGKVSIKMTIFRNIFLPLRFMEQVSCELGYAEGASLVLSDSRASTTLAGKLLGKPTLTILNQFNIRIEYPRYRRLIELLEAACYAPGKIWGLSDEILIADYPPPYTISKWNLVIPDNLLEKTSFIGPVIERLEENPRRDEVCRRFGLDPNGGPIIFYHASGPAYERKILTNLILPILDEIAEEYQVIATLGGDKPEHITRRARVYHWIDDPMKIFAISDLVICRAGQTTLAKALAMGKPVIMIPIPAHGEQLGNALSVAESGAGIILQQHQLSLEALRSAIRRILSGESFRESAEEYRRLHTTLNPIEQICSRVLRRIESTA
ncbi:MAG: glycosyltransferase [Nitrososphaerota archaeon]